MTVLTDFFHQLVWLILQVLSPGRARHEDRNFMVCLRCPMRPTLMTCMKHHCLAPTCWHSHAPIPWQEREMRGPEPSLDCCEKPSSIDVGLYKLLLRSWIFSRTAECLHFFALAWKSSDFSQANGSEFERSNFLESVSCSFAVNKVENFQSSDTVASSWDICVNLPIARCLFHCEFCSIGASAFLRPSLHLQRLLAKRTILTFLDVRVRSIREAQRSQQGCWRLPAFRPACLVWPFLRCKPPFTADFQGGPSPWFDSSESFQIAFSAKRRQQNKGWKILCLPPHLSLNSSWDLCVKFARCNVPFRYWRLNRLPSLAHAFFSSE